MIVKENRINIGMARKALLFTENGFNDYGKFIEREFYKIVDVRLDQVLKENNLKNEFHSNLTSCGQLNIKRSPEVLKILFKNLNSDKLVRDFLIRIFDGERIKSVEEFDFEKYGNILWSSDGAFMSSYNTKTETFSSFQTPYLGDSRIPQDYFSSFNMLNSHDTNHFPEEWEPMLYTFDEASHLAERMNSVFNRLENPIKIFISLFTNTLILKKIPNEKTFTSGTDSSYINRVVICNAHTVDDEVIADALVHEATHGLLTIIDIFNQWQPSTEESHSYGRKIYSPWTGNLLTIRNLVQAIYVWYGLYNFWYMMPKNFNKNYAIERIGFIEKGFEKLELFQYKDVLSSTTYGEVTNIKSVFN